MSTEEWIAEGALGLLSFITLIVFLRWLGPTDEDQQKPVPAERYGIVSINRISTMLIGVIAAVSAPLRAESDDIVAIYVYR